jgi:hypothetical protein
MQYRFIATPTKSRTTVQSAVIDEMYTGERQYCCKSRFYPSYICVVSGARVSHPSQNPLCRHVGKNGVGVTADTKGAASERDLRDGVDSGPQWVVLAQRCLHGGCSCLDGPRPALTLFAALSLRATSGKQAQRFES